MSKITPHDVSLTSLMDVTLDDHSDKQSVTKVREKKHFFALVTVFPAHLKGGVACIKLSFYSVIGIAALIKQRVLVTWTQVDGQDDTLCSFTY